MEQQFKDFKNLHSGVQDLEAKARNQLGTLGGGNHFIELCLDTEGNVWMMLHSGSRNIGKTLAEVRRRPQLRVADVRPRYYPSQRWIAALPGLREVLTWNCVLVLERTAAP